MNSSEIRKLVARVERHIGRRLTAAELEEMTGQPRPIPYRPTGLFQWESSR